MPAKTQHDFEGHLARKEIRRVEKCLAKQDKKKNQVLSQVVYALFPRKEVKKVEGRSEQMP